MDQVRWRRLVSSFNAALDLEGAARDAYLDEACAAEPELRVELQSMFEAHEATGLDIEVGLMERLWGQAADPDEIPSRLVKAMADRYGLTARIGAGGMATVYLADDPKHGRKVAVKVLEPSVAATVGPDRFLREIEIAAQLTHPHIQSRERARESPPPSR